MNFRYLSLGERRSPEDPSRPVGRSWHWEPPGDLRWRWFYERPGLPSVMNTVGIRIVFASAAESGLLAPVRAHGVRSVCYGLRRSQFRSSRSKQSCNARTSEVRCTRACLSEKQAE